MVVVAVDSQRRVYIPKDLAFEGDQAIMIQQGNSILLIPVPKEVIEIDVSAGVKELRERAEGIAKEDALQRARRRKQL